MSLGRLIVSASLANRFNRRKSVFAESYDPEGDDDEGEKVITCHFFFNIKDVLVILDFVSSSSFSSSSSRLT